MRRREPRGDSFLRTLARLPLFAASSNRELAAIARHCTVVNLRSGHIFAREGARCDEFVVLVSGSVVVVRDGRPQTFIRAGGWWGDIDILARTRSSSMVMALTDVECLVISRNEFLGLLDDAPGMRRRVVRSLASAARAADQPGADRARRAGASTSLLPGASRQR